ncbi:hypothetical protein RRF57_012160 [Xylaria bambusicola]|uniref:Uncharacterized protein n=1 Tax=Xylaria bambusicola TaxID=326684 RepID=A0AAN7UW16_9PEZI
MYGCYNALFPCENVTALEKAIKYCSTAGAYGATNYPAQATAVCGADKSAYMAACRCAVDCPSPTVASASEPDCSSSASYVGISSYPEFTLTSPGSSFTTLTNSSSRSHSWPTSSNSIPRSTISSAGVGSNNSTPIATISGSTTVLISPTSIVFVTTTLQNVSWSSGLRTWTDSATTLSTSPGSPSATSGNSTTVVSSSPSGSGMSTLSGSGGPSSDGSSNMSMTSTILSWMSSGTFSVSLGSETGSAVSTLTGISNSISGSWPNSTATTSTSSIAISTASNTASTSNAGSSSGSIGAETTETSSTTMPQGGRPGPNGSTTMSTESATGTNTSSNSWTFRTVTSTDTNIPTVTSTVTMISSSINGSATGSDMSPTSSDTMSLTSVWNSSIAITTSSETPGTPWNITTISMASFMTGISSIGISGSNSESGTITTSRDSSLSETNIPSSSLGSSALGASTPISWQPSSATGTATLPTSGSISSGVSIASTSTMTSPKSTSTGTVSISTTNASETGTNITPISTQTNMSWTTFPNSTATLSSTASWMATGSGSSSWSATTTGLASSPSNSKSDGSGTETSSSGSGSNGASSTTHSSSLTSPSSSGFPSSTGPGTNNHSPPPESTPTPIPWTATASSNSTIPTSTYPTDLTSVGYPTLGPTCISTPLDTGILDNGDFETGLSPWSLDLVDLFSTDYALISSLSSFPPGSTPGGGANGSCTAFEVRMAANPQTQDLRENLRLRSDLVFSRPGALLRISFYVRFAERNTARIVLSTNDELLLVVSALNYGPGGDATSAGNTTIPANSTSFSTPPTPIPTSGSTGGVRKGVTITPSADGQWTHVLVDYEAGDRLLQLLFSYELGNAPRNTIGLDQVAIDPSAVVHPPLSLPPPPPPPATTFATTTMRKRS